jgi:aspartate/methionine/tyrosine aminotransferase
MKHQLQSLLAVLSLTAGCSGYNPPQYVIDAAKEALDKIECNQYSPTKVCRILVETLKLR